MGAIFASIIFWVCFVFSYIFLKDYFLPLDLLGYVFSILFFLIFGIIRFAIHMSLFPTKTERNPLLKALPFASMFFGPAIKTLSGAIGTIWTMFDDAELASSLEMRKRLTILYVFESVVAISLIVYFYYTNISI